MATEAEKIETDTRKILSDSYEISKSDSIPSPDDVPYGKVAKRFKASVFAIDIRNSSKYLSEGDTKSGKLHKAFLRVCAATIYHFDGEIRSFNGDGLLAMWTSNYKSQVTPAVKAAMGIKWLLKEKMKDLFVDKYNFDFGIGLSWGEITSFRAGVERVEGANDLVFIDRSINEAVVISKQANAPVNIECTMPFYNSLEDEARLDNKQQNMWKPGKVEWKNGNFESRLTTYHWAF